MAILCIWKKWDQPAYRLFAIFLVGMNLWGIASFGMGVSSDLDHAIWWERFALVFIAATPVVFFLFAIRYSSAQIWVRFLPVAYVYLFAVIALAPTDLIVDGIRAETYGNVPNAGALYPLFVIPAYLLIIGSILMLSEARKDATSYAERNRFLYFMIGGAVFVAGGFVDSLAVMVADIPPASAAANILFVLLAGTAFLKERLPDIQVATYTLTPYAVMVVLVSTPFMMTYFILDHFRGSPSPPLWLWFVGILLIVALFHPLWQWVQSRSSMFLYRGRYEHLVALDRLREEAQSISDPSAIETYLPRLIRQAMQASHVHLMLPSHSTGDFETVAYSGPPEADRHFVLGKDCTLVQWMTAQRQLLRRGNPEAASSLDSLPEAEKQIIDTMAGELYVPLNSGERLVGLLIVGPKLDRRPYSWEDEKLLMRIGNQTALTMENIQLYQASLSREAQLQALSRLNETMSFSLDIQATYDVFAEELKKTVPVDWASIVLIEDHELRFFALSTAIESAWGQPGTTISAKDTGSEWVAKTRTPLVEPDLARGPRFWTGNIHLEQGIRSMVYLPLLSQGEVFGTFIVGSSTPDAYTDNDVAFLEQVANHLSLTMENARLYTRERGERHRLEAINKQREDFLSMISHELKTPLTSIKSSSELLSEELARDRNSTRKRLIQNIRRSTDRLESMLNNMLEMVRMRSAPVEVNLRSLDVRECVRNAMELCQPPIETKRQSLEIDIPESLPPIMADSDGFEHILTNLLGNANKFTPRGGSIRISVRASDSRMVIEVSDSGPGIPESEQEFIFEPFYRGEITRSGVKGMGVGLATVKQLVHLHGGTVRVKSASGKGSTFIVSIPLS